MSVMITALYSYPVKSCGALAHTSLALDARGPVNDRRWMIVDEDGVFLTQREYPTLAVIQPAVEDNCLRLSAPGMPELIVPPADTPLRPVRVWRDTCDAADEGDSAAAWLSDYLGARVRLARMADGFIRPVTTDYAPPGRAVGFADAFPLLIAAESSLEDLNRRLVERGKAPVPMSRFRPNVVVGGSDAYAEDTWRRITLGEVALDVVKPCARCATTTVDQAAGTVPDTAEPLATLNTYRNQGGKVMFAQNALHRTPGTLRLGDPLMVAEGA